MIDPPYNKIRLWVTNQSFVALLLLWIALYLAIGVAFSLLYKALPKHSIGVSQIGVTKNWLDLLYFSFSVQTTVGYGEYVPLSGLARLIATIHAIIGTIMNAIALGITTYKFIKHSSLLTFPEIVIYDPGYHSFWFRFINLDADDIRDAKLVLTIFAPNPEFDGAYDTVVRKVHIDYYEARWVPSAHLFALRTKSNNGLHENKIDSASNREEFILISPLNISNNTTLRLDLSGFFHTTGEAFYINKDYTIRDIRCGKYVDVDNNEIAMLSKKQKIKYIQSRFSSVVSTSHQTCEQCAFHSRCALDVALKVRLSNMGEFDSGA